jgi:hypothetical protein
MRDEIENNPRLFVALLITGVVATVVLGIFMLIIVWAPDSAPKVDDIETKKLGNYTMQNVTTKDALNKYCVEILNNLYSRNMDLISNMVLPEYISSTGLNKAGLEALLKQKGLIGSALQSSTYKSINHRRYGQVFEVTVTNVNNTFTDTILVIEKSPNNFKISFDGFVGLDKTPQSITIGGLKLDISEIREQTTTTSMKVKITNVSGHTIIFNKGNSYENIFLSLLTGNEIRTTTTWLSGASKELTNGYVINLDLEFLTTDLSNGFGKKLIIKDVYDTVSKEAKNIEYTIN